jgi:phosphatidylglycerol lysyltransferase
VKARLGKLLPLFASIAIIAIAARVLWRKLSEVDPAEVAAGFATIPGTALLLAGLFVMCALAAMAVYEVQMLRYLRPRAGWRRPFVTALIAFPIGHAVGFGAFSGGAIRYRIYSAARYSAADIGKLIVLSVMPYAIGLGLLAATAMLAETEDVAAALHLEPQIVLSIGVGLLVSQLIYVGFVLVHKRPLKSWWPAFELPSTRLTAIQFGLGIVEVLCTAAVLFVLLPPGAEIAFPAFVAVYVTAVVAGALSGVPAGLGVFESILLVTLADLPAEALLGAVLAYRLVYELLPFVTGVLLLLAYEAWAPRRAR